MDKLSVPMKENSCNELNITTDIRPNNKPITSGSNDTRAHTQHRSLQQRAAAYGGMLNLTDELPRAASIGDEVW